jgi:hypothetical protein
MAKNENKRVKAIYRHSGVRAAFRGQKEGDFVRISNGDAEQHPLIRAAIEEGDTLNNVWLVQRGQELLARVRVSKRTGGFAIAATVTLGAFVAIKVYRSHNEP